MLALAGAFVALACCLWVGAIVALVAHLSGRRAADYLLFAVMMLVAGFQSLGYGLAYANGEAGLFHRWQAGMSIAVAAGIVAAAVHLHFAIRYAGVARQTPFALGLAALVVVLEYLVVGGDWLSAAGLRTEQLQVMGLIIPQLWAPPTRAALAFLIFIPAAHLTACALTGRAYLKQRGEAIGVFLGSGVLGLVALNDALLLAGIVEGVHVLPLGFLALGLGLSLTFLSRYSVIRSEMARQAAQVTDRGRELAKARRALRKVQEELGKKEQLAVIGEMAAVIAHEVRNPLAVIANAVASLRREGLSRHDHDVLLGILDEEGERLNRIVSDLLTYARPISLQRQRVILQDVMQRAAMLASSRKDVKLVLEDGGVRGQIWADANLLRQVFDNLVDNAIQATGGSGTITVAVKPAEREGIVGFMVTVTDDGEGMDTLVRSRAKDPFFTTRPAGTGLGLAIVNRIVEAHGGDLSIQSRAGEGTSILVFLPIGVDSVPPPEPRSLDTDPPLSSSSDALPFGKMVG